MNTQNLYLDKEAFYGRVDHKKIIEQLLTEIDEVDFRELIKLPENKILKQKHLVVAVIKHLLQTAKFKNWNLCSSNGYTYIFNGAFWKKYDKETIKIFLRDSSIKMGLPSYEASHFEFADKLLKQFLSDAHLPPLEPVKGEILINLFNGTFEFSKEGFKKREFCADDFLTYQLPFAFDNDAVCPLFNNYLERVLPDKSSQMILQEFAGYIFSNLKLEKCLVLTGNGENGKSVFIDILNALIGRENVLNNSIGSFSHEYSRAQFLNKLLNASSEKGFDLHPDILKKLVSGEALQAREIYQKPFTLVNLAKFLFACNLLPTNTENTIAFFRRFLILQFDIKITQEEKDIHLADKIIEKELPGVFNWLLKGLARITEQEKFTYSEKAELALTNFKKDSDSTVLFIEENFFLSSEKYLESLTTLYALYKIFCRDNKFIELGKNKFSRELEKNGFEKKRQNSGYYFFIEKKPEL